MTVLNNVVMEVDKNGRKYTFTMPVGTNIGEAYDASLQILQEILKHVVKSAEQVAPKEVV